MLRVSAGNYIFVNGIAWLCFAIFVYMIFRVILIAFILILIIRFIIRYLLPIISIGRSTHDKLKEMQRKMEEMQHQQQAKDNANKRPKEGDYIEYEEVK